MVSSSRRVPAILPLSGHSLSAVEPAAVRFNSGEATETVAYSVYAPDSECKLLDNVARQIYDYIVAKGADNFVTRALTSLWFFSKHVGGLRQKGHWLN